MHLHRESAAGVRFLAAVKEGGGLKASARAAGVGKETGYRWLRESFLALRVQGLGVEAAQAELGYISALFARWDRRYPRGGPSPSSACRCASRGGVLGCLRRRRIA